MTTTPSPNSPTVRRRGVLALLDGTLPCYAFNPELLQETAHAMSRRHRTKPNVSYTLEVYNPTSEWTLFFLADSYNLNSIRFRPILVDFVQQSHSECQCICVPNHEENQDMLCGGTGFLCLPWQNENRAGILR